MEWRDKMEIKVGEIIKAKREEKDYSLVGFAKRLGISPGYLSQLENGRKNNPKLEIVLKIIKELEIDIDMLLGVKRGEGNFAVKIPSLLKLVLAKDRNIKVLEDKDVLRKLTETINSILESRYYIENRELYLLFLEDISIHTDTILKRYMGLQVIGEADKNKL